MPQEEIMPAMRFVHRGSAAWSISLILAAVLVPAESRLFAAGPRVLPPGDLPNDTRLGPLRGERGDFSFTPAKSADEWKQRAARVRQIMRVSSGLWPPPTKTPLKPVIHGKVDRGEYTVQRVYFQSLPEFYVTGNLYRPKGRRGKRPGVLSPHGHFPGGRFQDAGRDAVRRSIAAGAERFEEGGRSFMQSRCVQLARMGCVVFHYDMIGYADSVQLPLELAHRFSRSRVKFNRAPAEGLYSAAAELRMQNVMGLHTYNSIRALDFLAGLDDVDPKRIAVTGGSGGGTQTFMLCAVDDRPLVSVPVVIVSTTRQGGCTCENICGFRIGTYNLEFTALHAPKPLLLISADDATRTMRERGFPELKQHYTALGAKDNVSHVSHLHFPHNYNYVSRTAMYHWLNRHLGLGLKEPIVERPYRRLTREEMTVWNEQHPRPKGGPEFERRLLDWLTKDARQQMDALSPRDPKTLKRYREVVGGAWDVLIRSGVPASSPVRFEATKTAAKDGYRQTLGLLRYRTSEEHQAELPVVLLSPKKTNRTVLWIDEHGKSGLYTSSGELKPPISRLLHSGAAVIGVDLLYQGEFLADGRPPKRARWLKGEEAFAGWTYCYNMPVFAHRVHDILAVVALARKRDPKNDVALVGLRGAGPCVTAAVAQSHGAVTRAAIDTGGFRFAQITDVYDLNFLPGAAKYHDLPGLLALSAPTKLWLAGEGKNPPPIIQAAYRAVGTSDHLMAVPGKPPETAAAAVRWLLKE